MFGDKDNSDAEEVTQVTSLRDNESEDGDFIISTSDLQLGLRLSHGHGNDDTVTITIATVTIDENASILKRKNIQIFVAYRFLNVPVEETETPFSLPKPEGGQSITFNFTKVVAIDLKANYERRQFLASMLLPNDPEKGRVKFTIVCEPTEDNYEADCEDVGAAYISLPDILKNNKDVTQEDVPIHDVSNPKKIIGHIQLSFECLCVLQAIKAEMAQGVTDSLKDDPRQSTMFGDEDNSDAEEVTQVTSLRDNESEDGDFIVSTNDSQLGSRLSHGHGNADTVTITIAKVTIDENASILKRKNIQIFVAYRFLNVPVEETETPFSLPKPEGGQSITFNFTKVVAIDFKANYERRQFLASMLLPNDPEKGRVKFTIVCEPTEDNYEADCEDLGAAYISLPDILKNNKDVTQEDVPIHDVSNPKKIIGHIQLSFECLSVLQAVKAEMAQGGTDSLKDDPRQSTMFGDEDDSNTVEASKVTSPCDNESQDRDITGSKNDSPPGSWLSQGHGNADTVTITIAKVTIDEGASILKRKGTQMFVAYRFLNIPMEETETPFSLPKPKGGQSITFNFTKIVAIDFKANYERRQFLAGMLLPNDSEKGRVKFTIVCEPPEDNDEAVCEDVGAAYISLPDILKNNKDVTQEDVPIHDVSNPKKIIGHIQLSFECLSALQAVKSEMEA